MAFLLNSQAVLLCPHGGTIQHIPTTNTTYRINGYPPLLLTDTYLVLACPHMAQAVVPMKCDRVQWVNGSHMMMVKGVPVLTNTSTGLCLTPYGVHNGPVVVATPVNVEQEPTEFTNITQ